jgi:hypothetical protein
VPLSLAPPAPFPLVLAQRVVQSAIAPGMRRARYDLVTAAGPLVVEVVAIDPREPSVRFGTVLAHDRLISPGETVSAMAGRTQAVAGVNADYFDIGQTNQPLNVVVKGGALVHSPSARIALDVRRDRSIHFERLRFGGSATYPNATLPITGLNVWPPEGGASLLTSDYGALPVAAGVTVVHLQRSEAAPDARRLDGAYRVAANDSATTPGTGAVALALGPAALALAAAPVPGDAVTVATQLEPAQADVVTAVGGGPLLIANGAATDDPNAPAPEERNVRFPVSGAALTPNGTLLLVSVDGREPAVSIGVTRPEFGALMLGFGATDGMAFDSGGSATLVARELGDPRASVLNVPSDGEERAVADGFFAYSDAPVGAPALLVVRPAPIVALPNAEVPVRVDLVDAAGHALGPAHLPGGDGIFSGTRSRVVSVRASGLTASVPVRVVTRLARIEVSASVRVAQPAGAVSFSAVGKDDDGSSVALGDGVRWSADNGSFDAPGRYRAGAHDARIVARAGGASATFLLPVGVRRLGLTLFDTAHVAAWQFATAPANLAGSLRVDPADASLDLSYDFTTGARAAYATASFALPGEPLSFATEIDGDAGGAGVRAAFINALGERRALTLAKRVDWLGWRLQTLRLPDDLNPPVRLVSLYVVPSLGTSPGRPAGTLRFRNPSVVVAGTP